MTMHGRTSHPEEANGIYNERGTGLEGQSPQVQAMAHQYLPLCAWAVPLLLCLKFPHL